MKSNIKILTTLFFAIFWCAIYSQEICNDAIDNDQDGLIDLNDDDCDCIVLTPVSLIPNPSFEENDCCPTDEGMLDCAVSWSQASTPTTDYLNTCGITGHPFLGVEAPMPFPDGEACVGFRDGKWINDQFKEYVGSCLTKPMELNKSYRMDFFVGFHAQSVPNGFKVALFGTDDCQNLPFGNGDLEFGCPANSDDWDLIAELAITGDDEWINVVFEFNADKEYEAIILGSGCEVNPDHRDDPYFFLDNLTIAATDLFGEPLTSSGNVCKGDLKIEVAPNELGYQWYHENIAIVGETNANLSLTSDDPIGVYKVIIDKIDGCYLSAEYIFVHPNLESYKEVDICEGETVELGTKILDESGYYEEMLVSEFGCDSIASIDLKVYPKTNERISRRLCPEGNITIGSEQFTEAGNFEILLTNENGCDSLLEVEIINADGIDSLELKESYQIKLGDTLQIAPTLISLNAIRFEWCVGNEILSTDLTLSDIQPLKSTEYILKAYTEYDCEARESVNVVVDQEVDIYFPNVFTQDGLNNENYFFDFRNSSVDYINQFKIFDRWGGLMYSYTGETENMEGWNGYIGSERAQPGVYLFMTELQLVNQETRLYHGSFTLVR